MGASPSCAQITFERMRIALLALYKTAGKALPSSAAPTLAAPEAEASSEGEGEAQGGQGAGSGGRGRGKGGGRKRKKREDEEEEDTLPAGCGLRDVLLVAAMPHSAAQQGQRQLLGAPRAPAGPSGGEGPAAVAARAPPSGMPAPALEWARRLWETAGGDGPAGVLGVGRGGHGPTRGRALPTSTTPLESSPRTMPTHTTTHTTMRAHVWPLLHGEHIPSCGRCPPLGTPGHSGTQLRGRPRTRGTSRHPGFSLLWIICFL
jgi:hypothetical protein